VALQDSGVSVSRNYSSNRLPPPASPPNAKGIWERGSELPTISRLEFFVFFIFGCALASSVFGAQCSITPKIADLGDTFAPQLFRRSRFREWNERTIHLFPQADGGILALMPFPVKILRDRPSLDFLLKKAPFLRHGKICRPRDSLSL